MDASLVQEHIGKIYSYLLIGKNRLLPTSDNKCLDAIWNYSDKIIWICFWWNEASDFKIDPNNLRDNLVLFQGINALHNKIKKDKQPEESN